jgi:hypothetical protein
MTRIHYGSIHGDTQEADAWALFLQVGIGVPVSVHRVAAVAESAAGHTVVAGIREQMREWERRHGRPVGTLDLVNAQTCQKLDSGRIKHKSTYTLTGSDEDVRSFGKGK